MNFVSFNRRASFLRFQRMEASTDPESKQNPAQDPPKDPKPVAPKKAVPMEDEDEGLTIAQLKQRKQAEKEAEAAKKAAAIEAKREARQKRKLEDEAKEREAELKRASEPPSISESQLAAVCGPHPLETRSVSEDMAKHAIDLPFLGHFLWVFQSHLSLKKALGASQHDSESDEEESQTADDGQISLQRILDWVQHGRVVPDSAHENKLSHDAVLLYKHNSAQLRRCLTRLLIDDTKHRSNLDGHSGEFFSCDFFLGGGG